MDLQLKDKHILITGGSKGIGYACAEAFLQEGAKVFLLARNAETLATAAARLHTKYPNAKIAFAAVDLKQATSAAEALAKAEAHFGAVDVLVNSAGAAVRTPLDELTPQAWHDAMDAKYFTYLHMMDPVVKKMAARGSGNIVNVIGAGGRTPSAIHLPGGAANAALMLVSAGLAAAYAPQGIRVNAVNPGATTTERLQQGLEAAAKQHNISIEEALKRAAAEVPMRRLARPEEVAQSVLFLASPMASYVNGVIMTMDGARSAMVV